MALLAVGVAASEATILVRAQVVGQKRYRLSRDHFTVTAPPPFMTERVVEDLRAVPGPDGGLSVFEEDLAWRVARYYGSLPWVEAVQEVRVVFPNRLVFRLDPRRPAAMVEHGETKLLLDRDGVLLPPSCYRMEEMSVPRIAGVSLPTRLEIGKVLASEPLQDGLAVIRALDDARLLEKARPLNVEVRNSGGKIDPREAEIVLFIGRARIEWGRSPRSPRLKLDLSKKVNRLRFLLNHPEELQRMALIRLQFDETLLVPRDPSSPESAPDEPESISSVAGSRPS